MSQSIEIRPMEEADFLQATDIMLESFRSKLLALKDWPDERVRDLMLYANVFHKDILLGHYVAVLNKEVAGILHLKWYENAKLKAPDFALMNLFRQFGFFPMIRTGLGLLMFNSVINRGEMAVDFIAVSGDHRGKGIGSKLLEFGEDFAKSKKNIRKYTLMVIGRNQRAKNLYERQGFFVKKHQNVKWLKWLTSIESYDYMVKDV